MGSDGPEDAIFSLEHVLEDRGWNYYVGEGAGAFYSLKSDLGLKMRWEGSGNVDSSTSTQFATFLFVDSNLKESIPS
jgi:hypothetical protein